MLSPAKSNSLGFRAGEPAISLVKFSDDDGINKLALSSEKNPEPPLVSNKDNCPSRTNQEPGKWRRETSWCEAVPKKPSSLQREHSHPSVNEPSERKNSEDIPTISNENWVPTLNILEFLRPEEEYCPRESQKVLVCATDVEPGMTMLSDGTRPTIPTTLLFCDLCKSNSPQL